MRAKAATTSSLITREQLSPEDGNEAYDVYYARVDAVSPLDAIHVLGDRLSGRSAGRGCVFDPVHSDVQRHRQLSAACKTGDEAQEAKTQKAQEEEEQSQEERQEKIEVWPGCCRCEERAGEARAMSGVVFLHEADSARCGDFGMCDECRVWHCMGHCRRFGLEDVQEFGSRN